jgi:uncharacterized protein YdgA (DUF945 family)
MPIRINLLTEALAEEELRRRDPVKRAIYIGVFLVALSLVWFSSTWLEGKIAQQTMDKVEIAIASHTNQFNEVEMNLNKISDCQRQLNELQQLNTNRFLEGNLLNALQQVYVPNVQLLRLKLDQNYVHQAGVPDKVNNYGVLLRGRPGTSTEQITLILDGKDSSPNLDQMNHFKEALADLAYFKTNLNPINGIKLSSLSSPQTGPDGKPFVVFTLECHFRDQTR